MEKLTGKTAIVTGGSDGIGFGIANAFAKAGANLVLIGRDKEKLAQRADALEQCSINVRTITADLSNSGLIDSIAEQLRKESIWIDILVNNAGFGRFISFADTDAAALDYHLNLNVKAPYLLTQALLNDLIRSQGNVINISSYFARRMLPDRPSTAYSLTKGALESFTKALAFELGPKGVRVNAIAPGTVDTPQVAINMRRLDDSAKDRFHGMIQSIYPLQKIGDISDVGNMAAFLASNQAKWITGGVFPVDGGLTTN
jgi:NAD(P)-dependent dehydrogenase (short-subunit alcohol dehydrogenase family)